MDMGLIFPNRRTGDGVTQNTSSGALLDWRPLRETGIPGKSGTLPLMATFVRGGGLGGFGPRGLLRRVCREKLLNLTVRTTVPQTDTGVQLE